MAKTWKNNTEWSWQFGNVEKIERNESEEEKLKKSTYRNIKKL